MTSQNLGILTKGILSVVVSAIGFALLSLPLTGFQKLIVLLTVIASILAVYLMGDNI